MKIGMRLTCVRTALNAPLKDFASEAVCVRFMYERRERKSHGNVIKQNRGHVTTRHFPRNC